MDYRKYLKFYPDFPIKGVNFVDIIPLIQDKALFRQLTHDLAAMCETANIAAPEARGFLFSTPMLYDPDIPVENVIPLRKKGKLPFAQGDLIQVEIMKEYGPDHVYFRNSDIAAGKLTGDTMEITFFDDAHLLPFDGAADWRGIRERLRKYGFQGPLTFELRKESRPGRHTHDRYAQLDYAAFMRLAHRRAVQVMEL